MRTRTQTQTKSNRIGFRCMNPRCGQWVGDRRYVGPAGHAPRNLCFECRMAHWDKIEARAANGGQWTCLDEAMWLICRGLSLSDAADLVASDRTTLRLRIAEMRRRPELIPDWLRDIRRAHWDQQN